jgi:hypothetical protein
LARLTFQALQQNLRRGEADYAKFLSDFNDTPEAAEAQKLRDFDRAMKENSPAAFQKWLRNYPGGALAEAAQKQLDRLEFFLVWQQDDSAAYGRYAPSGAPPDYVQNITFRRDFRKAEAKNHRADYTAFLKTADKNPYQDAALNRLKLLEEIEPSRYNTIGVLITIGQLFHGTPLNVKQMLFGELRKIIENAGFDAILLPAEDALPSPKTALLKLTYHEQPGLAYAGEKGKIFGTRIQANISLRGPYESRDSWAIPLETISQSRSADDEIELYHDAWQHFLAKLNLLPFYFSGWNQQLLIRNQTGEFGGTIGLVSIQSCIFLLDPEQNGLVRIDLTSPISPNSTPLFPQRRFHQLLIRQNLAYLLDPTGLLILDLSDPRQPVIYDEIPELAGVLHLAVSDNRLVTWNGLRLELWDYAGLHQVNRLASRPQISLHDLAIEGNNLYLIDSNGFFVYDMNQATSWSLQLERPGVYTRLHLGQKIGMLSGGEGLTIFDRSDPKIWKALTTLAYPHILDLNLEQDRFLSLLTPERFIALDCNQSASPETIASIRLEQHPSRFSRVDNLLTVAGQSLTIIDLSPLALKR